VFLTSVVDQGESEAPKKGLYLGGNRPEPPKSGHQWKVICLDLSTGRVEWEKTVHQGTPQMPIHLKNSYGSETPVTDGERVYAIFGGIGVFAFTLDGKEVWSKPIEPHAMRFGWGTAASPVLHDGRLFIVNDNDDHSELSALEAKTGKELWRVGRDEKSNWATPFIWKNQQRTELITPGTNAVRSYDLDGKLLWSLRGMSSIVIPTPSRGRACSLSPPATWATSSARCMPSGPAPKAISRWGQARPAIRSSRGRSRLPARTTLRRSFLTVASLSSTTAGW